MSRSPVLLPFQSTSRPRLGTMSGCGRLLLKPLDTTRCAGLHGPPAGERRRSTRSVPAPAVRAESRSTLPSASRTAAGTLSLVSVSLTLAVVHALLAQVATDRPVPSL